MISSSVLIAVFAFSANTSPHRRQGGRKKEGHAPTSWAFIGRKLPQTSKNNSRCITRVLLASSSSSTDDSSSEDNNDSNVVRRSSSSAAPPKNREKASASKREAENTRNSTTRTATKTAKATKIIDTTPIQRTTNTIYNDDKSTESSSTIIQGLLPNKSFNLLCRIHCTITLLRKHFPSLLELPALSSSTARYIYNTNVTITGPKNETLAEGLDEVLLLNRALATAAVAARRAGSFLDLTVLGTSTSSSSTTTSTTTKQGHVECELLIDPTNPLKMLVLWRTRLPSILSSTTSLLIGNSKESQSSATSTYTEFSGKSTLDISPDTGLVTKLQINEVKINGVVIIESLGTALAAVRKAARSAMASSILFDDTSNAQKRSSGNPLLDGLLNGLQDVVDAVDALPSSDEKDGNSEDSPLYVVPQHLWDEANFAVEEGRSSSNSTNDTTGDIDKNVSSSYIPIAIDHYSESLNVPLAGSEAFVGYATSHSALQSFAIYGLPQLSGVSASNSDLVEVSTETIRSLFATDAELVTSDKNEQLTLLRGAGKIADLYRSLALLREATPGRAADFEIESIEADLQAQRLIVDWKTETPLKVEGTDVFVFETPTESSCRLPLGSDGDKEEVGKLCNSYFDKQSDSIPLKIKRVENLGLKVAGVNTDSAWAQSFVSAMLRSGIAENTPLPDATIQELLRALTSKRTAKKAKKDTQDSTMPSLDGTAALSFYNIIRALHNNLPNIVSTSKSSSSIPAGEYLAETVELRGLLGEVLVRGDQPYRRLLGVAISSLRAAIQTNTVRLAATPKPTVEVTSDGKIKVQLVLALWVTPQLPLGKGSMGQSQESNQGFGVPLKIEITSEYIVDETGRIREHIILESRLNGVLTPGDAFAKWIKGLTREEEDEGSNSRVIPSAFDSLMDAMAWVRSMQADRK